jgi:hypothetical protein
MKALELPVCGILLSVTLLAAGAFVHAADDSAGAPSVSCRVSAGEGERTYDLRRTARGTAASWTLTMRGRGEEVVLPLPGAEPAIGPETARLAYRSANGGRLVDLDVSNGKGSLSVWVDHGLEVNVDPDLDPRVDEMSIERTAARCEIVRSSGANE